MNTRFDFVDQDPARHGAWVRLQDESGHELVITDWPTSLIQMLLGGFLTDFRGPPRPKPPSCGSCARPFNLPERHEDRSKLTPIRGLRVGDTTTVIGTVKEVRPAWNRFAPLTVTLTDGSGGLLNAVWFRQPHLFRVFQIGQRLIVHGRVSRFGSAATIRFSSSSGEDKRPLQLQVVDHEILEDGAGETLHAGRLVPIYRLTEGIAQRSFRAFIKRTVDG